MKTVQHKTPAEERNDYTIPKDPKKITGARADLNIIDETPPTFKDELVTMLKTQISEMEAALKKDSTEQSYIITCGGSAMDIGIDQNTLKTTGKCSVTLPHVATRFRLVDARNLAPTLKNKAGVLGQAKHWRPATINALDEYRTILETMK